MADLSNSFISSTLSLISNIAGANLTAISATLNANTIDPDISFITNNILSLDTSITSIDDQLDVNANLVLTYTQSDTISLNQDVMSTVYTPVNTDITSSATTPLLATSPSNMVTSIADTQPTDITHTPIGIEPPLAFKGQYPYVHTHKTESGHIIEHDDTPGQERLFRYHKAGTYEEINPDGRRVVKVNDDNVKVVLQDDKLHVEGSGYVYVQGNITVICLNDVNLNVAGRVELTASEDLRIKASAISMESTSGDINIYSAGNLNTLSQLDTNMTSQGNMAVSIAKNSSHIVNNILYMQSTGDTNLNAGGNANIQSGGDTNLNAGGNMYQVSGSTFNIDGGTMNIQNGTSAGTAATGKPAQSALQTGLPAGPDRSGTVPSVPEALIQGTDDDLSTQIQQLQSAISSGRITQAQYDSMTQSPAQASPPDTSNSPSINPIATDVADILSLPDSAISESLRLSAKYRLADFTSPGPVFKYPLIPWQGRTKARLAGNLALLARNCVEPIATKYGPIQINSGFRSLTGSSQHSQGMACDITYGTRSTDPATMYEIAQWIRDHVLFDQLILEYGTSQIWTHVSYNGETGKQRQMLLTCPSPATNQYTPGLVQLSWTPNSN